MPQSSARRPFFSDLDVVRLLGLPFLAGVAVGAAIVWILF